MIATSAALLLWTLRQPAAQNAAPDDPLRTAIACAPGVLPAHPVTALRVVGGETHGEIMFGPGDPLVVNAGTSDGLRAGQEYFVRREVHDPFSFTSAGFRLVSIHTAGWITIVDAREHVSVATVTHACDGIIDGDYLEPYAEPPAPPSSAGGAPDFAHPARILMADERRQMGYAGLLMLIDRGSNQGVRAGQTITIFRDPLGGRGPIVGVGSATVLETGPATALVQIDSSDGAVYVGDLAAIHRIQ
jgi:hypothetical protein